MSICAVEAFRLFYSSADIPRREASRSSGATSGSEAAAAAAIHLLGKFFSLRSFIHRRRPPLPPLGPVLSSFVRAGFTCVPRESERKKARVIKQEACCLGLSSSYCFSRSLASAPSAPGSGVTHADAIAGIMAKSMNRRFCRAFRRPTLFSTNFLAISSSPTTPRYPRPISRANKRQSVKDENSSRREFYGDSVLALQQQNAFVRTKLPLDRYKFEPFVTRTRLPGWVL